MKIDDLKKFYHYHKDYGYVFEGHRHSSYEMNIVLKGKLEITCGDSVFYLEAGEAAVWWAGIFHRNRVISRERTEFLSIHFSAEAGAFDEPTRFSLSEKDLMLMDVLEDEIVLGDDGETGFITPASAMLFSGFLTRLCDRGRSIKEELDTSAEIYRRAVGMMADRIGEDLRVPDIARYCGVCVTLLKKAFSQYAGKGVKEYFIDMKIEHAKKCLLAGEFANVVSLELGFSSPAYFSQTFKRICGVSPREFVKDKKSQNTHSKR